MKLIGALLFGAAVAQSGSPDSLFRVEITEARWPVDAARGFFWVGLHNVSPEPQHLCVSTLDYSWAGSGVTPQGTVSAVSHSCERPEEFTLLLPGETRRILKHAAPPTHAPEGSEVSFTATLVVRSGSQPEMARHLVLSSAHRWSGRRAG
jgi:hypothetical protein